MAYYVKQGQSSFFSIIKLFKNECQISQKISNSKKIEKVVKKIKKKNINPVVLSKKIKENQEFIKMLNNYDITILDGKWLMKYMIDNIIKYLKEKKKLLNFDEVTILANDLTDEVNQNIKKFTKTYKKIRIVTNHLDKFRRLEHQLYEREGISIIITNNKRKALAKSELIINFDFVNEVINQYNINENAIIINLYDKIKIDKKRFSGIIITDYEVEIQNMDSEHELEYLKLENILNKQEEFCLKEILEERIYSNIVKKPIYSTFETVENIIKNYDIKIKKLHGKNGIIT